MLLLGADEFNDKFPPSSEGVPSLSIKRTASTITLVLSISFRSLAMEWLLHSIVVEEATATYVKNYCRISLSSSAFRSFG